MLFFLILRVIELFCRFVVHTAWLTLKFKTDALLDCLLGECCFFVAAIFAVGIMFCLFKEPRLSAWKGSALKVIVGVAVGLILGFLLSLLQLHLLRYLQFYVSNQEASFPFGNVLLFTLLLAVTEELLFRYYLFQTLEKHWGTSYALIVSSVIFAGFHLLNPGWASTLKNTFYVILVTTSAGLLFCSCLILTRRMWMSISLHFAWDFFNTLIYGDVLVGVSPWFNSNFNAQKVNQFSAIFLLVPSIVIIALAVRKGQWQHFPKLSVPMMTHAPTVGVIDGHKGNL